MAYTPVSRTVPQYQVDGNTIAAGYFLKGYTTGTTTPLSMATDDTGGTLIVKCKLSTDGYPLSNPSDDTTIFIPHFSAKFKLALYSNTIDADNNTTANAVWVVDAIPVEESLSKDGDAVLQATAKGTVNISPQATAGQGGELRLEGEGSDGNVAIDNSSGNLRIFVGPDVAANFVPNGAVTLYFNGAIKTATTIEGLDITGTTTAILDVISSGSNPAIIGVRTDVGGSVFSHSDSLNSLLIQQTDASGNIEDVWISCADNGPVTLRFNNIKEFETKSGGVIVDDQLDVGGLLTYTGTVQTLTGAGAVNITTAITEIVTTGADALTLADGAQGQRKFIVMKTDGGDGTLTPTNLGNGATITFDDVGDSADLIFTNAAWHFMGGTATLA